MLLTGSRRWIYALLGLWAVAMLSVGSLFLGYGRVFSAGHSDPLLPATADTVHWGYFSQTLEAELTIDSSDAVTIETSP